MQLTAMYPGVPFSPPTALADAIGPGDTTIPVEDGSVLPDGPNLAVIGTDESGEVILYAVKAGNTLSGCTRGVEGTAQEWNAGSVIGRNWTNKDYATLIANVSALNDGKPDKEAPSAAGNLAALAADGSLQDSGKKPADFLAPVTGAAEGNLPAFGAGGTLADSGKKPGDFLEKVPAAVEGNLPAFGAGGGLQDSGIDPDTLARKDADGAEGNLPQLTGDGGYADSGKKPGDFVEKVTDAAEGNLPTFGTGGALQDSGKKPADFVEKVTAAAEGNLPAFGAGGALVDSGTALATLAPKSVTVSAALTAAGWTGAEAPYTQAVAAQGVTADAGQTIIVAAGESLTAQQYAAAAGAQLWATAKGANTVTVTAFGEKPAVDLPVTVTILG